MLNSFDNEQEDENLVSSYFRISCINMFLLRTVVNFPRSIQIQNFKTGLMLIAGCGKIGLV